MSAYLVLSRICLISAAFCIIRNFLAGGNRNYRNSALAFAIAGYVFALLEAAKP